MKGSFRRDFLEHNLGVDHYDPVFDKWFLIPSAGADVENNTIRSSLTNHFSSFSVQATVLQDLSPQEYKDAGYSSLQSYLRALRGLRFHRKGGLLVHK